MRRLRHVLFAVAALASAATCAVAEIRGYMTPCGDGRICPWFQPVLAVPPGWREDKAAGEANRLTILVPAGNTFAGAPARIYGRAFLNAGKLSLAQRVRASNARWLAVTPGARAERVAGVMRANGRAPFEVYRYDNPGRTGQGAELVAFGEEIDARGEAYGVMIVLTTPGRAVLEANENAYRDVLAAF